MTTTKQLMSVSKEPAIQALASQIYDLANGMRVARGEIDSTKVSMAEMQAQAFRGLGVVDAIEQIKRMTPELRTQREIVNDTFKFAVGNSRTSSEVSALVDANNKFNASMDEQDRRQAALKAARSGGRLAVKADNQWDKASENFQQRIDSMRLEQETLGQSTYVIERNKAAMDLLNQAKQAGIPITSTVIDQINRQTEEYASVSVEMERMHERQQQIDQINGTLASGFSSLFQGVVTGSQSAAQGISNLLGSLGSLFINKAFQMLFSGTSIGGGLGGGLGSGGLLGGKIIPGILHDGGMAGLDGYSHGRSFSPSTWDGAVRYHTGGIAGLRPNEVPAILERGETITPRYRGSAGGQASGAANMNLSVIVENHNGSRVNTKAETNANGEKQLRVIVRSEFQEAQRRGAVGF
jgi:hypothetical protein